MPQQRRVRRSTRLSKKAQLRLENKKNNESTMSKVSRIVIIVVLAMMVISLAYTIILLSNYK